LLRLITQENPNTDHLRNVAPGQFHKTSSWTMLSMKKLVLVLSLSFVIPGAVAYAGFFSFLGEVFTKAEVNEKPMTSQNLALLVAANTPEATLDTAQTEVSTVAGSALLGDAGPAGGLADIDEGATTHGAVSAYVVQDGDTLASIADKNSVSINTILWANNLSRTSKIVIGQSLVILPVSGVKYTVKRGDTVVAIAKKYKGDADEIRNYNGLADSDTLISGTVIIIPDGQMPAIVKATTRVTSKLHGVNGPSYDGYYAAPLASYRKTQGLHGYNGIDLAAPVGTAIHAAADGTVVVARQGGYNGGYGNYVVIQHANGTQTLYGHMLSVAVSAGATVTQGETVGYLGNTGRSTGPHLHFEVRGARNPF